MRWVVIPLTMPNHSQDEWGQAKRLRAGDQLEGLAKVFDDRFLNACHEVARRDGM